MAGLPPRSPAWARSSFGNVSATARAVAMGTVLLQGGIFVSQDIPPASGGLRGSGCARADPVNGSAIEASVAGGYRGRLSFR